MTLSALSAGSAPGSATGPSSPGEPAGRPSLPLRRGSIPLTELIGLYMAHYEGRDSTRVQRLAWWKDRIGAIALQDLSDDEVHAALEQLSEGSARYFAGKDADGRPVYKAKRKPMAPATINRYAAALAAVITWSIRKRIAPKGMHHACRAVERRTEDNAKTRFLSADERERLLQTCKTAPWPRLYLLVLLALTTGARKSELLALRWQDVDLARGVAVCGRSKNGDAKSLPLVASAVEQLRRFAGAPGALVFPSDRLPDQAFTFEEQWADALQAARIRNFRFHDLRHSCASMLAAEGATLLEIADVLGHRQLQMTKRYSHLTTQHKAALVNRVLGGIQ